MMKIFVCGADKSGKSTLTDALARDLKMKRVHFTCPKPNLTDDDVPLIPDIPVFNQIVKHTFQHRNESLIYDRYIYSDIVYGPIYRNPDMLAFRRTEQTYSELVMQSSGMVGIYAESSDFEKNLKMINDEGEGVLDKNGLFNVRNRYRQLASHFVHVVPTFMYDWTKTPYDSVLKFIESEKIRLEQNGFYSMLKDSGLLMAGYLGPIYRRPEVIVDVPDISYDSYLDALMANPKLLGNHNVALTVDRPLLNKILDNIIEQ